VEVATYFGTIAQVIPVAFIVVAFELANTLELREPRGTWARRPTHEEVGAMSLVVSLSPVVTAVIGEATALNAVHTNSASGRAYILVAICLGSMALTVIALSTSVWLLNAGTVTADSVAGDNAGFESELNQRRARELRSFAASCDKSLEGRQLALLALTQATTKLEATEAAVALRLRKLKYFPKAARAALWLSFACALATPVYWLVAVVIGL
jgi:hypothetical protein